MQRPPPTFRARLPHAWHVFVSAAKRAALVAFRQLAVQYLRSDPLVIAYVKVLPQQTHERVLVIVTILPAIFYFHTYHINFASFPAHRRIARDHRGEAARGRSGSLRWCALPRSIGSSLDAAPRVACRRGDSASERLWRHGPIACCSLWRRPTGEPHVGQGMGSFVLDEHLDGLLFRLRRALTG